MQLYSNQGVSCRNIGQEQLRVKQSFSARMTIKNSLFGFNSNGLLNHGKEGKTRYYVIQCRFSEFLVQMCIKNAFIAVPCRNITTMRRNIAFFGVRAEILLSRNQGRLDSRAGPFLGYVQIYSFLEKYSPLIEDAVNILPDQLSSPWHFEPQGCVQHQPELLVKQSRYWFNS